MPSPHPRPFHRGSLFCDGPRVPLDRERRAQWKARLVMFRRARKLTPLHEDIGLAMLRRLGTDGRLDPSHQTLADDVGCHPRSVLRALSAMLAVGLTTWSRRLMRVGVWCSQTSNAYELTLEKNPSYPLPLPVCQSHLRPFPAPAPAAANAAALAEMKREAAGLPDLLAARLAKFTGTYA